MNLRRGYTLVELLVALAIAVLVIAGAVAVLIYTARGYRREDLQMVRSRVALEVLTRLDDDIQHLDGPARVTTEALRVLGYERSPIEFLLEPRRAVHILNAFTVGTIPPDFSKGLPFEEQWMLMNRGLVLDCPRCRYLEVDPRPTYDIFPAFSLGSAMRVPVPPAEPKVIYLPMSLGRGLAPDLVLWAFVRKTGSPHPPGAILRWSMRTGLADLTREARLLGNAELADQWLHVTTRSGGKLAEVFEVLLAVTLEGMPDPRLPFTSPPFVTRRVITAGL